MALLKSKSGYSYDTETGVRTNPDNTTINLDKLTGKPIPLSSLETTTPMNLPEQGIQNTPTFDMTPSKLLEAEQKKIQDTATQSSNDVQKILEDIGLAEARQNTYAEDLGATENRLLYKDYENKLTAEKRALELASRRLKENPGGMSQGGLEATLSDLEDKSLEKQADIAILGNMALGKYNEAISIAKDKVELELKPLTRKLEYYDRIDERNQDLLSDSQKETLASLRADVKAEKDKEKERLTQGNEMIVNAIAFGAPNATIENAKNILSTGGTSTDVAKLLGKYSGDYYKAQLLKEQVETEKAQRASIVAKTEADKLATKPATQAQYTASGFASRVVQAKDLIDQNQPELIKLSALEQMSQRNLPNVLKSPLMQTQEQAERNFVNAVLRRESGAAISPEEFKSAEKQYFPRPGDSAEVLMQKKQNRDLTSQNLINESGTAYQTQTTNLFNQALGKTDEKISGTSIISSLSNGIINFNIPKN